MPVELAFQVRTDHGTEMGRFSKTQLLEGLRSGWVRLEDEVQLNDGEWKSIRYSLCEDDFAFAVFRDPAEAHGDLWKLRCQVGGGLFGLVVGVSLLSASLLPDLGPGLFGALGQAADRLAAVALLALAFGVVGGWLGSVIGQGIGRDKAPDYRMPPSRTPAPDWVTAVGALASSAEDPDVNQRKATLGPEISRLRIAAALSLDELAAKIGCRRAYLARIEEGAEEPTTEFLATVAQYLSHVGARPDRLESLLRQDFAPVVIIASTVTPKWAWVFAFLCGIIPVLTLGGAIPGAVGFGGAGACLAVSRNRSMAAIARISLCFGITATAWILVAALVGAFALFTR